MQNKYFSHSYLIFYLWLIVYLIACISSLYTDRSVSVTYFDAAWNWLHQSDLYSGNGAGFIYLPQSAILYTPFAILPYWLSELTWRSVNFFIILYFSWHWLSLINKQKASYSLMLLLFSLIFLPVAFSSLRNGQMNITIVALSLVSLLAIKNNQLNLAGFILVLCFFFKPTAIVLLLLVLYFYPRMWLSIVVSGAFFLLLPFITTTDWHYALAQYQDCYQQLTTASQVGSTGSTDWAQFFNLLAVLTHIELSAFIQDLIRVVIAIFTLLLCIKARKQTSSQIMFLWVIYALFSAYLMLFNPRSENNDYLIISLAIAVFCVIAVQLKHYASAIYLIIFDIGIITSRNVSHLLTPDNDHWVTPLMALLFYIYIAIIIIKPKSLLNHYRSDK